MSFITSRGDRTTSRRRRCIWRRGSRVVVVDYRGGRPGAPHGDQPELQITLPQLREWMRVAGFELTQEFDLFDEKFFVVFTKRE